MGEREVGEERWWVRKVRRRDRERGGRRRGGRERWERLN